MPEFPTGALGASACVLAACSLPSATLDLSHAPVEAANADAEPPARPRKLGRDFSRPQIDRAELLTSDHLRLHFSEPLAPLTGVDPRDFRLSMGMAKSYKFYAYAYYYDLIDMTVEGESAVKLERLTGQADTIDVYLDTAIYLAYCHEFIGEITEMASEPGIRVQGGIFLHYSPGESPIADPAGNALAPIGPEWVLRGQRGGDEAYDMYFEGPPARRALRGLIPIDCGPAPIEPMTSP